MARDLSDAEFFDEDGERKRKNAVITADRVATLNWLRERFFSKGLGYAGEVIEQAIKELEAQ